MVTFQYVVKDVLGIHARPAGLLVKEAGKLASKITVKKGEKSGDAGKIFGLMSLGVKQNDKVTVTVEGDTEKEDAEVIRAFFESNL